jgi:hypothetical protein
VKRFLFIFAMIGFFASLTANELFAQQPVYASATAQVTLAVNVAPALTKNRDMSFGTVNQGVTSATVNPVTDGNKAAMFTLSASANTPVTVTYTTTDLTSGPNVISFNSGGVLSGNNVNVQASSTSVPTNSTVTTNGTGYYYFWAGGTATLAINQPAGTYSGSFTLQVSY